MGRMVHGNSLIFQVEEDWIIVQPRAHFYFKREVGQVLLRIHVEVFCNGLNIFEDLLGQSIVDEICPPF